MTVLFDVTGHKPRHPWRNLFTTPNRDGGKEGRIKDTEQEVKKLVETLDVS